VVVRVTAPVLAATLSATRLRDDRGAGAASVDEIRLRLRSSDPTQTCCAHFTIDDPCAFLDNLLAAGKRRRGCGDRRLRHDFTRSSRRSDPRSNPADPSRLSAGAFIGRTLKDIKGDSVLKRVQYQTTEDARADRRSAAGPSGGILGTRSDRFEFEVDNKGRVVDARREAPLFARLAQLEREVEELRALHKGNGDGDGRGTEAKGRKKS